MDAPAFEQPILSAWQLIVDEHGDQVERREPLRVRVAQPRVEHVGHAGEAERPERAVEFTLFFSHTFRRTNTRVAPYDDVQDEQRLGIQVQMNF